MSEASKVPLEHMFKSRYNCSADCSFNTRAPEEGKACNETDDEFRWRQHENQLYNLLENTIFPIQTDKVLKESLHMFDTKKINQ